ncbi:hypothetical protein [Aquibacillus kalidii]|uniref:hypothetical protein n=1 Tax=Aquibacillus kalidii TaxID=2762597 RepID=UPI0016485FAA|nr:hypothetical protein [Aquibacillus kalidii]
MKQAKYGLLLYIFLALPPVASLMESVMIVHMHMQLTLLVLSGFLMGTFFKQRFASFFNNWNQSGVPGVILAVVIWAYWMIPRIMDETLTMHSIEIFKYISLPFLVGVPLRDSWKKVSYTVKHILYIFMTINFIVMGWIYVAINQQICNNYLLVEQRTLGFGSFAFAACMIIYGFIWIFSERKEHQQSS